MKFEKELESWPVKLFFVYLAVCAHSMLILVPVIVGALVDSVGLTTEGAGFFAAANAAGIALISLIGFFTLDRWHLRRVVWLGCLLMSGGFGFSCFVMSESGLISLQLVIGIGAGMMVVSALGLLGRMQDPDGVVALMMVGQFVFGAVGFQLVGHLLAQWSVEGVFVALGLLQLPLILFIKLMPVSSYSEKNATEETLTEQKALKGALSGIALMVMLVVLLLFGANQAIYTYVERIGVAAGMSFSGINDALTITNLAAIGAGLFIAWLGAKLGRAIPLLVGMASMAAAVMWLQVFTSDTEYKVANALIMMSLMCSAPYLTAILIAMDPAGRLASFANCMITVGAALGPYLGSVLLMGSADFWPLIAGVVFVLLLSMLFMACVLWLQSARTIAVSCPA